MSQILFETLGCRLNQIESESAARFFVDFGFSVTMDVPSAASPQNKDILLCIVNTCAVTQKAEQKARREVRLLLEKCPHAAIIVTGCYAALSPDAINALDTDNMRIAVLSGLSKNRLADVPRLLLDFISRRALFSANEFCTLLYETLFYDAQVHERCAEDSFRLSTDTFLAHSRASLKIQDGCNAACSYCAIRLARGKSVSLGVAEVLERVKALQQVGQCEIVFTAVNIAQYYSEYNGMKYTFTDLLEKLLDETSGVSFRISSIYPEIVDARFCKIIAHERVRPHFHLSVQHGSNKILQAMNRPYRREAVVRAVEMLRKVKGNPFIACDIIAGFPGETDDDFAQTLALLNECTFSYIHAFPFSARPGTVAFSMKQKVPERIARERVFRLMELAKQNKIAYIESQQGKTLAAIAEGANTDNVFRAVTENFIHCTVACNKNMSFPKTGSDIRVRIAETLSESIKRAGELEAKAVLVASECSPY